ncbi:MAG: ABC transporter substrate-binding protein [Alphaproteobacteria bacterium]|nr:ABC transporter substrate-binding protein [Alphaproteobacteria bacterium]
MKKLAFLVVCLAFVATNALAEINTKKAEAFIEKLTTDGIEELVNSNASKAVKQEKFRKLFNEDLDLDFIGKFVLGRYWRTATPTQQKDFLDAYRELNIQTWSARFDEFKGKTFEFQNVTPSTSQDQVFVNTIVDMKNGQQPAKVVWRVRQKGETFKVVDIIIENVSLAISARNEYAGYIKANGLDALIKDLQTRAKKS